MKLFPEFTKLKNDEEQLDILIMVVNETYVKSDINNMYATIFAAMSSMKSGNESNETDPDEPPLIEEEFFNDENETNYTYPEDPEDPNDTNETNETDPEEPPEPLAFQDPEDTGLFDSEEQTKHNEPELVADEIPDGKNVKEHDSDHI